MLPSELVIGKKYYAYSRLDKKKEYKIILTYEGIDEYTASDQPTLYIFNHNYMGIESKFTESELLDLRVNE